MTVDNRWSAQVGELGRVDASTVALPKLDALTCTDCGCEMCYIPCLILVLRAHLCFPYLASFLICTYRTALPLIPD
jgi:hypothetical protein